MILVVAFGLAVLSVPLLGGSSRRLASLQLQAKWLLFLALGIQIAIVEFVPSGFRGSDALHLCSYALAIVFLLMNRRIPGLTFLALGALANVTAITANGGVMPASAGALARAGQSGLSQHFANSTTLAHPRVAFLGDVFAIPHWFPLANVFSIGDVLLLVGGAITVHAIGESRPARAIAAKRDQSRRRSTRGRPSPAARATTPELQP